MVRATFDAATSHVEPATVTAAELVLSGIDCLVAWGGGAAVGTAKALAARTGLPIMAVPTTYSGSEMTPVYGLTEAGVKVTQSDESVRPRVVLYDPDLTLNLPGDVTARSALNAMAHCIAATDGPAANPVSCALGYEGARAVLGSIEQASTHPRDRLARAALMRGAHLAGLALSYSGAGLHHRICHVLGGITGLAHADLHAAVLAHSFQHAPGQASRAAELSAATGQPDPAAWFHTIAHRLGVPATLQGAGVTTAQLARARERIEQTFAPTEAQAAMTILDEAA